MVDRKPPRRLDCRYCPGRTRRSRSRETAVAYILALDEGTTSARAMVFDADGAAHAVAQREIRQIYPQAGWVEQDPREIWAAQSAVAVEALALAGLGSRDVAAIGIANQRETSILWDRESGEPLSHAIVWQDRRTAPACDQLLRDGREALIQERTGLLPDAYFSGTKIAWMLDHVEGARARAEKGELAFGTVDTWLVWKLTDGRLHVTDASNASRTMLFDIHTGRWDDELLRLLRIPRSLLPEVRSSSEVYGEVGAGHALAGHSGGRHRRRPAGRAVRPDVHRTRPHQEHVRDRVLHASEHRRPPGGLAPSAAHDGRLEDGRTHRLRARGQRLQRRGRGAVAPGRPGLDSLGRRDRGSGRLGAGQRGRLPGAGLRRARRSALGPVCARRPGRAHPRHHRGPRGAGRARGHRLSGRRPARRDARRLGRST